MTTRIKKLQKRLNETVDEMDALNARAEAEERDFDADETATYTELTDRIKTLQATLERERDLETLKMQRAQANADATAEAERAAPGRTGAPAKKRMKGQLLVDLARTIMQGGQNPYAQLMFADQRGLKEATAVLKAVTNPADTTTAGWAAELVQQEYSDFIDLLRGMSIYANIPSRNALLGRNGSLLFPGLLTDASGDFIGEGQPIPCVEGVFNISEAKPYKLGVITVQTAELMNRSDPASDMEIRDSMVNGTAVVLDSKFTDNTAASAGVRPAGLQTHDSTPTASGGDTIPDVDADLVAASGAMISRNMTNGLVWLVHPARLNSLRYKSTATGTYPYAIQIDNGTLGGYPFLSSTRQPADIVMLVHTDSLYKLIEGSIDIQASMDATIHTSTTPEQIVSGGAIPALPTEGNVRSMFQEASVATRLIMPAAWHVARADAVEVITGVSW